MNNEQTVLLVEANLKITHVVDKEGHVERISPMSIQRALPCEDEKEALQVFDSSDALMAYLGHVDVNTLALGVTDTGVLLVAGTGGLEVLQLIRVSERDDALTRLQSSSQPLTLGELSTAFFDESMALEQLNLYYQSAEEPAVRLWFPLNSVLYGNAMSSLLEKYAGHIQAVVALRAGTRTFRTLASVSSCSSADHERCATLKAAMNAANNKAALSSSAQDDYAAIRATNRYYTYCPPGCRS
jgi:hypothetical protein